MKANELMVGNYVSKIISGSVPSTETKINVRINEIFRTGVETTDGYATYDEIRAIPLSGNLLKGAGFKEHPSVRVYKLPSPETIYLYEYYTNNVETQFAIIKDGDTFRHILENSNAPFGCVFSGSLNLHRLQNCFYALTGFELELEVDKWE
jgi:hypothetical protein